MASPVEEVGGEASPVAVRAKEAVAIPAMALHLAAASRPARDNTAREAPEVRLLLRREPLDGRKPLRPPPRTVQRPSKAGNRLQQRIRVNGNNTRIKTSRRAKKEALRGLNPVKKDTRIEHKPGSKPRSNTIKEGTTPHQERMRNIMMTTTGTMAKLPPWRSVQPRSVQLADIRRVSPPQRQQPRQPHPRLFIPLRHPVPAVCHAHRIPLLSMA
ncbi:hypothetical protein U2W12_06605 [Methylomicrobium sp. Wu6]|nr:hypothetical protein [Methylomicrobium sp. Wu6]